jgi:SAM-dependent methyltransferase
VHRNDLQTSISDRARQWLKGFPSIVRLKKAAWDTADRVLHSRDREIIRTLSVFVPNSAGSTKARAKLTLLAANQTFPFIVEFLSATGQIPFPSVIKAEDFCTDDESRKTASQLKCQFDRYGSDKANDHNYHQIYGSILRKPKEVTALLEIGLGTNNQDVVSNMGRAGKPGASLRAFRDFLPNAKIYGADVDRRILFREDRIETFFVDQTDLNSLAALSENVGTDFDLIIDDGLHSPNANIAVLAFALSKLKNGGWLVVEDIGDGALSVWQVIAALLPTRYKPQIISAKGGLVFLVERIDGN